MNSESLLFHPEDTLARATGRVQIRRFTSQGRACAWAFFPNGLQLLAVLKRLPIADIRVIVRHGTRHDALPGTAHALEHLVCKDVLREGPHPALRPLLALGLERNASTTLERTAYSAQTRFPGWKRLLRGLLALTFASETIDERRWLRERSAILQEIHQTRAESAISSGILAGRHPQVERFRSPGIGTTEHVMAMAADDLRAA